MYTKTNGFSFNQDDVMYREVLGQNNLIYTVFKSYSAIDEVEYEVYGIRIDSNFNGKNEYNFINDFSVDLSEAMEFAELIMRNTLYPASLQYAALDFLNR